MRPISVPSCILIHPTVWPQYTNVTSRQDRQTGQRDRQDNGREAQGELLLVTVAPKARGLYTRARYIDKSDGDGVETENSFTLGEIAVAVSVNHFRSRKTTSGRETTTPALTESTILSSELAGQQSESL